jgi:hypothetical protein
MSSNGNNNSNAVISSTMPQPIGYASTTNGKLLLIIIIGILIGMILFITIRLRIDQSSQPIIQSRRHLSAVPLTSTFSPQEMHRWSILRDFLNLSVHTTSNSGFGSSFMRTMYDELSDGPEIDDDDDQPNDRPLLIAVPNRSNRSTYHFDASISLDDMTQVELILPWQSLAHVQLVSSQFHLRFDQPCSMLQRWCRLDLTAQFKRFPLMFTLTANTTIDYLSSAFIVLHFRRATPSTALPVAKLVSYPDDPSHCQVRPYHVSFARLQWTPWIVEPRSFEMNVCSGTCHSISNMKLHSIIQILLHEKSPHRVPAPCCRPRRLASALLLYYDGVQLVLKRHRNMRVVACQCFL